MKWFKHDSDSWGNAKIKKLILKYGAEGYAIYFHCLELITGEIDKDKITFELEHDSEIIADNLKIKSDPGLSAVEKVNNIMMFLVSEGMFEENNGRVFCFKLARRLDNSLIKNPQLKEIKNNIDDNYFVQSNDNKLPDKSEKILESQRKSEKTLGRSDKIRLDKNKKEKKASPSIFNDLKIVYNNFLLANGYSQEEINTLIFQEKKQLGQLKNLFSHFKNKDDIILFLKKAEKYKFAIDNRWLPAILNSQYSNIMVQQIQHPGNSPPETEMFFEMRDEGEGFIEDF